METDFYLKNLATNLWNFKQHDILCDTTIVAQNGEEIFAHSVILSAASNQLKSALSAETESCSGKQCKKYRLSLVDYEPLLLNTVLQYMYTGQLELLKTDESCSVQHPEEFLRELCGKLGLDLNINNTALQTKTDDNTNNSNSFGPDCSLNAAAAADVLLKDNLGYEMLEIMPFNKDILNIGEKVKFELVDLNNVDYDSDITIKDDSYLDEFENSKLPPPKKARKKRQRKERKEPVKRRKIPKQEPEDLAEQIKEEKTDLEVSTGLNSVESNGIAVKPRRIGRPPRDCKSLNKPVIPRVFACRMCPSTFFLKNLLKDHMKTHAGAKPYVCSTCHKGFVHKSLLVRHSAQHANGVDIKSEECDVSTEGFETIGEILTSSDEYLSIKEKPYVCSYCGKGFYGGTQLKRHLVVHEDDGKFICSTCGKGFPRKGMLLRHEISHTGAWPSMCTICNKGFLSDIQLAEHFGMHTGERPYQCLTCGRRFTLEVNLMKHVVVHAARTLYNCKTCGKNFKCLSYLKSHQKGHEGIKPFMCDICGKGFLGSSNLNTHRRIHTGERPYACTVCDKRFLQVCAVREHERIHVGEKQYVCDTCGKMFMTYAQLYNHIKIHIGIKDFVCDVCNKRFFTNGDMVKHQRIHKDQRPFVCDVCGKGFKYSSNLHGHVRIHTGSRPYVCLTCGKGFTYSSHLSRHNKLHVREKMSVELRDMSSIAAAAAMAATSASSHHSTPVPRSVAPSLPLPAPPPPPPATAGLHPLFLDRSALAHQAFAIFPNYDMYKCK